MEEHQGLATKGHVKIYKKRMSHLNNKAGYFSIISLINAKILELFFVDIRHSPAAVCVITRYCRQ